MYRTASFVVLLCTLVLCCGMLPAYAAGPLGLAGAGNASIANLQEMHVGWVRVGTKLPAGKTSWDDAAFAPIDTQVANLVNAGIQVIMLINHESYKPTSLASWNVNSGGSGQNDTINDFAQNYAVPIILRYKDRGVKIFEIWNEPNMANWYIQPSCYSSILTEVYCRLHYASGHTSGIILTGGDMYGWGNEWGTYDSAKAGADYLDQVYSIGKSRGAWDYCKNTFGSYPLDAVAQHIYLNTVDPAAFSATNFQNYIDYVHNVAVKYGDGAKKTYLTEWGFEDSCLQSDGTNRCNSTNQDADFKAAFGAFVAKANLVVAATYYRWDDCGDGEYFGLVSGNKVHKTIWNSFVDRATFEGKWSNGAVDTVMQNYYNSHGGQARYGNPWTPGSAGVWVHQWLQNNHWANVQDYDGGSIGRCCLFENGKGWSVEMNNTHGFWDFYMANGNMAFFDAPSENEHTTDGGTTWEQQCYVHTMYWTAARGCWYQ